MKSDDKQRVKNVYREKLDENTTNRRDIVRGSHLSLLGNLEKESGKLAPVTRYT